MERSDLRELHYIVSVANLGSIFEHGILCFERASKLRHVSVAMPEVQERRDRIRVPGGLRLHQYANLYFNARNPMLYKRKRDNVVVLSVDCGVLDLDGVVVTDMNAASPFRGFFTPEEGFAKLDKSELFARSWIHEDNAVAQDRHRKRICAEVLVPARVPPKFIRGVHVSPNTEVELVRRAVPVAAKVNEYMFFGGR